MKLENMKEAVEYSNSTAFVSKWQARLDSETRELVNLWVDEISKTKSTKATASYKSLVSRFLVTEELSEGKSGDSMKSAVRSFIRFCEKLQQLS